MIELENLTLKEEFSYKSFWFRFKGDYNAFIECLVSFSIKFLINQ